MKEFYPVVVRPTLAKKEKVPLELNQPEKRGLLRRRRKLKNKIRF